MIAKLKANRPILNPTQRVSNIADSTKIIMNDTKGNITTPYL